MLYDNNAIIGQMIRRIRNSLNITQKEMAKKLSVTPQTISAWELGKRTLNQGEARLIFEKFNISVDDYKKFLPEAPKQTVVRYCTVCGTIHTCPHPKALDCCGKPSKSVDKCKCISSGYMVYLNDGNINVSMFDTVHDVKYIAYIGQSSTDIFLCEGQHIPHAEFKFKENNELYVFFEGKGLFKINTPTQ